MESRKFWRFALCLENPSRRRETITTTIRPITSFLNPKTQLPGQEICNRPIPADTSFKERKRNFDRPRNLWPRGERMAENSSHLLIIKRSCGSCQVDTNTGWTPISPRWIGLFHPEIERFKDTVMNMRIHGLTIEEWRALLASEDDHAICDTLASRLDIKEQDAKALVK